MDGIRSQRDNVSFRVLPGATYISQRFVPLQVNLLLVERPLYPLVGLVVLDCHPGDFNSEGDLVCGQHDARSPKLKCMFHIAHAFSKECVAGESLEEDAVIGHCLKHLFKN